MEQNFETALQNFAKAAHEQNVKYFERAEYTYMDPRTDIEIKERGKRTKNQRFAKLWYFERGVCLYIHAFVEIATGDIYMPASTKVPAKNGVRGNIYSEYGGREALMETGRIRYSGMRGIV